MLDVLNDITVIPIWHHSVLNVSKALSRHTQVNTKVRCCITNCVTCCITCHLTWHITCPITESLMSVTALILYCSNITHHITYHITCLVTESLMSVTALILYFSNITWHVTCLITENPMIVRALILYCSNIDIWQYIVWQIFNKHFNKCWQIFVMENVCQTCIFTTICWIFAFCKCLATFQRKETVVPISIQLYNAGHGLHRSMMAPSHQPTVYGQRMYYDRVIGSGATFTYIEYRWNTLKAWGPSFLVAGASICGG